MTHVPCSSTHDLPSESSAIGANNQEGTPCVKRWTWIFYLKHRFGEENRSEVLKRELAPVGASWCSGGLSLRHVIVPGPPMLMLGGVVMSFFADLSIFSAISIVGLSLDLPCKKTSSLPIGEISGKSNHRAAYT